MYKYILGVDPGLTGGISVIHLDSGIAQSFRIPTKTEKRRRKKKVGGTTMRNVNMYDVDSMFVLLKTYRGRKTFACIERVSSRPGEGVTSSFNFGKGAGLCEGICVGLNFEIEIVRPQTWKKVWSDELLVKVPKPSDVSEKDYRLKKKKAKEQAKDNARALASKLYPKLKDEFKLKRDDGKAESLLIAEWKRLELSNV